MPYTVTLRTSAVKELRKIPVAARQRITEVIDALADNPRPQGVKKMTGIDAWRIRVGDYRVIYSIVDQQLVIEVIKIGNRRDIYR